MAIKIDGFISTGIEKLEKKFMGGVSPESAKRAISETAQAVEAEMERVSRQTVEQINTENLQARKMLEDQYLAQLEQKDREMLSLSKDKSKVEAEKENIQTKLGKLTRRIENAFTYKEKETLADGSKVFVKTSLGGTKATKTVNKEGKLIQLNIESPKSGLFRRTTYNPETGKPVRRITNATKDGKTVEIKYDSYGNIVSIKPLNVKKVKPEAPKVVGKPTVTENTDYHIVTEAKLSDGTILTTKTERATGEVYEWAKRTNRNSWPIDSYYKDKRSGVIYKSHQVNGQNGLGDYNLQTTIFPNGMRTIQPYSRVANEMTGIVTETTRIIMPKGAPVKRIDVQRLQGSYNDVSKNIITLWNGEKVVLTDFKHEDIKPELTRRIEKKILVPQKAVKIAKDGTQTEIPHDEIRPWLESFHPGYNDSIETKMFK